jgi:hypothetical protein
MVLTVCGATTVSTLEGAAGCGDRRELVAFEDLFKLLIGELQSGDAGLAQEPLEILTLRDAVLEELVDRGVDAADENRVHRPNSIDGFLLGDAALQTFDVRARGFFVPVDREDQGDVDVEPFVDALFDRRQTLFGAGNLDHHVRTADARPKVLRHRDRALRVVSQQRRDLQADEAVVAARLLEHAGERVARVLDVGNGEIPKECLGILLRADQLAKLIVVVAPGTDRFFEDRRVAGHASQTLIDQSLQLARGEHAATNVIEPYALPGLEQLLQLVAHVDPSP